MTETKVTHDCGDVRWLECDVCGGAGGEQWMSESGPEADGCSKCKGTGLRFPELSRQCDYINAHGQGWEICPVCQDRERVLVDDEGAWLDTADSLVGSFWTLQPYRNEQGSLGYECYMAPEGSEEVIGTALIRLDAIKQAICKATGVLERSNKVIDAWSGGGGEPKKGPQPPPLDSDTGVVIKEGGWRPTR